MFRNSLFAKIYLWFWVATIFTFVTIMIVDRITESERRFIPKRHMLNDILPPCGLAAVETFEHAGSTALTNYIGRFEKSTGTQAFLVEGTRQLIPDRGVAADLSGIVSLAAKGDRVEFASSREDTLAACRINGNSGKNYVFAVKMPTMPFNPPPRRGPPPPPFSWLKLFLHLTLSGIVCYGLARYLTRSIVTLRDATRRIASGDLSVRVSGAIGKRKDEISDLANDFDVMTGRVEGLLRSQKNLLRDISHELRSPLARLNVALELCRRKLGREAEVPLSRIERESEKLNDLIGQLLDLNVLESGVPGPEDQVVDLAGLLHEIAVDAEFEAASENKAVSMNVSEGLLVRGKRDLLHRAVENIVRNAIRYSRGGSVIEVKLDTIWNHGHLYAQIMVRDHGNGVPEESLANLFKPFYRVAEDRDRQTGGMGLGLAITEAAVRYHQGKVSAANAPGGGLAVTVLLPLIEAA